jgi:hypothetical protein
MVVVREYLKDRLVVHERGPRQSLDAAQEEDPESSEDEISKPETRRARRSGDNLQTTETPPKSNKATPNQTPKGQKVTPKKAWIRTIAECLGSAKR